MATPVYRQQDFYYIAVDFLNAFIRPKGRLISVSGPDGVGKTTLINTLSRLVDRRVSIGARLYHSRPYLISRLAEFLPRRRRNEILTARRYEPRISRLKTWLRVAILICDYNFGYWLKVRPHLARGRLVIFDRYFMDIRVDPQLRGLNLSDRVLGFIDCLIPQPDLHVLLTAAPLTIASRKDDLSAAKAEEQLARYRALAAKKTNCLVLNFEKASASELSLRIINWLSRPAR